MLQARKNDTIWTWALRQTSLIALTAAAVTVDLLHAGANVTTRKVTTLHEHVAVSTLEQKMLNLFRTTCSSTLNTKHMHYIQKYRGHSEHITKQQWNII